MQPFNIQCEKIKKIIWQKIWRYYKCEKITSAIDCPAPQLWMDRSCLRFTYMMRDFSERLLWEISLRYFSSIKRFLKTNKAFFFHLNSTWKVCGPKTFSPDHPHLESIFAEAMFHPFNLNSLFIIQTNLFHLLCVVVTSNQPTSWLVTLPCPIPCWYKC